MASRRRIKRSWKITGVIIGAVLVMALLFCWLCFTPKGKKVRIGVVEFFLGATLPSGYVYGIDVSHFQGTIHWDKVKYIAYKPIVNRVSKSGSLHKDISFAIAKATEGSNELYDDDTYNVNYKAIRSSKMKLGAYHVLTPGGRFEEQASHFLEVAKLKSGDIRPILDVENDIRLKGEDLKDAVKIWSGVVENYYGCKPIIYTSAFLYTNTFDVADFEAYDFWIAQYNNPVLLVDCVMWQFTSRGVIPGVDGKVDLNVLRGGRKNLNDLLIP